MINVTIRTKGDAAWRTLTSMNVAPEHVAVVFEHVARKLRQHAGHYVSVATGPLDERDPTYSTLEDIQADLDENY